MQPPLPLMSLIWRGKWIIFAVTALFAAASIFFALSLENQYTSEVVLAPSEFESEGGLGNLTSQLGGIASIAGLPLGGGENSKVGEALSLLKSRSFLLHFIEKYRLLPQLLAAEGWDSTNQSLTFDKNIFDPNSQTWTRQPPKGKEVIPTPWEGYEALIKSLSISDVNQEGTLLISMETVSPELSKQWLVWLIDELNQTFAQRELAEARKSIQYLQQQIANTPVKELQSIFYRLVEEQTKKVLLTEVRDDYVFKILAEPYYPEDKSGPPRGLIVIALTFLGAVFSVIGLVVVQLIRSDR